VHAVLGQLWAKIRAIVAGHPRSAGSDLWIGAADHFDFNVGDDVLERNIEMAIEVLRAQTAEFLASEKREVHSATRTMACGSFGGQVARPFKNSGHARSVIIGAVEYLVT